MVNECGSRPYVDYMQIVDLADICSAHGGAGLACKPLPSLTVITALIKVYPKLSWSVGLKLAMGKEAQNFTVKQMRDMQINKTVAAAKAQGQSVSNNAKKNRSGWTKHSPTDPFTNSLQLSGESSLTFGSSTHTWGVELLKKEFTRYKSDFALLNGAEKALKISEKLLKEENKEFKLFSFALQYPAFEIKGKGDVQLNQDNQFYTKRSVNISFAPLLGIEITFDVIQALSKLGYVDKLVAELRAWAAKREKKVAEGGNGAYVGLKFDITLSGSIGCGLTLESDEQQAFFMKDPYVTGKLKFSSLINLRGGIKYLMVDAYFSLLGSMEAAVNLTLQQDFRTKDVELIFHHDGVKAKLLLDAAFGENAKEANANRSSSTNLGKQPRNADGTLADTKNLSKQLNIYYEWPVLAPLLKDSSQHKITLLAGS